MRIYLANLFRRLANWLAPVDVSRPLPTTLSTETDRLVADADGLAGSGEYKRHIVYAQLMKTFPLVSKRDLAMAIELAIQRQH